MTREEAYDDSMFHHKLVCQAHAYTNASEPIIYSSSCSLPRVGANSELTALELL